MKNIPDTLNEIQEALAESLKDSKDKIIFERLEALGISLSYEEEEARRFKMFKVEYDGLDETLYYNDGSINGLRVVTFTQGTPKIEETNGKFTFNLNLDYHY